MTRPSKKKAKGGGEGERVVLFWPDSKQVSTEDISILENEESRYAGAVTSIKMSGSWHQAVVRLISSDNDELLKCEAQVGREIDMLQSKEAEGLDRRNRGARSSHFSVRNNAQDNAVTIALGQKPKPRGEVSKATKDRNAQKRHDNEQLAKAQRRLDEESLPPTASQNQEKAVKNLFGPTRDEDGSEEEGQASSDEDDFNLVLEESSGESDIESRPSSSLSDSELVKQLRLAAKGSASTFFATVTENFFPAGSENSKFLEVLPISKNTPQAELSKGTGVYIKISDKNKIKADGGGDPAKMARLGLVALYGREALESEKTTAKGYRAGSKAMRKEVLAALLAFVNRNRGPTYPVLEESKFNSILNRKKSQLKRNATPPGCNPAKKTRTTARSSDGKKSPPVDAEDSVNQLDITKPAEVNKAATPTKSTTSESSASGIVSHPISMSTGNLRPQGHVTSTSPWKVSPFQEQLQQLNQQRNYHHFNPQQPHQGAPAHSYYHGPSGIQNHEAAFSQSNAYDQHSYGQWNVPDPSNAASY